MLSQSILPLLLLNATLATALRLEHRGQGYSAVNATLHNEFAWQVGIVETQPLYAFYKGDFLPQGGWLLGVVQKIKQEKNVNTLKVRIGVLGRDFEVKLPKEQEYIRPAYEVGTPVVVRQGYSWVKGWVTEPAPDPARPLEEEIVTVDVGSKDVVKCSYLNTKCIMPRTREEALAPRKAPAALGAFGYFQCKDGKDGSDALSMMKWETMTPEELRTLVYVFDDDNMDKPNCFLQSDVQSNVNQASNVVAPWVGYTADNGAGGRPYQPFQYLRFYMYGARRLIDRQSGQMMLEKPGCYEFSQVENNHVLRWGRWDDQFGASTADTGSVHGAKTYQLPIYKVTTDGQKCKTVMNNHVKTKSSGDIQATCIRSVQSALNTVSVTTPFNGGPLGHIPSCQCAWYPKMQKQKASCGASLFCMGGSKSKEIYAPVTCKAYGRNCYDVPGVVVSSPRSG